MRRILFPEMFFFFFGVGVGVGGLLNVRERLTTRFRAVHLFERFFDPIGIENNNDNKLSPPTPAASTTTS